MNSETEEAATSSAYLVHPALAGPMRLGGPNAPTPPLTLATMPESWLAVDEEAQDEAIRALWAKCVRWASSNGLIRAEFRSHAGDAETIAWVTRARRLVGEQGGAGAGGLESLLISAFPLPIEVTAFSAQAVLLRVYQTWDGILLYADRPPVLD